MSSLLEDRYRRALRLLPASYRQRWEEEMVATFLDGAYAAHPDDPEGVELGKPDREELASIVALAVRLRLGGVGTAPRPFAWGEAVRLIALVGLLAQAVTATVSVVIMVWTSHQQPELPPGVEFPAPSPALQWWNLTVLLWVPAYLALLHRDRWAARVLGVVALLPALITGFSTLAVRSGYPDGPPGWYELSVGYALLVDALPVLALAAFHRSAPPVHPRPWLLALPVGVVGYLAAFLLGVRNIDQAPLVDPAGAWAVGLAVAAVIQLPRALRRTPRQPHWAMALALLALVTFGQRVIVSLAGAATFGPTIDHDWPLIGVWIAEAVAALATFLAATVVARRVLRELPATPSSPAGAEPADLGPPDPS